MVHMIWFSRVPVRSLCHRDLACDSGHTSANASENGGPNGLRQARRATDSEATDQRNPASPAPSWRWRTLPAAVPCFVADLSNGLDEHFHAQARRPYQASQRPGGHLLVVRHGQCRWVALPNENDVAATMWLLLCRDFSQPSDSKTFTTSRNFTLIVSAARVELTYDPPQAR
jgi:hypothetical protein